MLSNLISAACLLVFMGCCLTGLAVYFTFELLRQSPTSAAFVLNLVRRWMGL